MNYWIHRISHEWEISYSLFDMGFLSLGWHYYASSRVLDIIESDGIDGFNRFMSNENEKRRSRWSLWYFSQFNDKDIVLVPLYNGEFAICRIIGKPFSVYNNYSISLKNIYGQKVIMNEEGFYCSETSKHYDIGFLVKVEHLKKLKRSYATADLVSRMKIRQTNGCIDDLAESVEAAINAQEPVSLHDEIVNIATDSVYETFMKFITPSKLEHIIKWYMKKKGADRVYIPARNEKGKENGADADVIAEFDDLRIIFYIQVKKHEGVTDEWAVYQISEYLQQKQDESNDYTYISWVVSTADFSDTAILKARENNVRLIGRKNLIKMLLNCGICDIDEAIIT